METIKLNGRVLLQYGTQISRNLVCTLYIYLWIKSLWNSAHSTAVFLFCVKYIYDWLSKIYVMDKRDFMIAGFIISLCYFILEQPAESMAIWCIVQWDHIMKLQKTAHKLNIMKNEHIIMPCLGQLNVHIVALSIFRKVGSQTSASINICCLSSSEVIS